MKPIHNLLATILTLILAACGGGGSSSGGGSSGGMTYSGPLTVSISVEGAGQHTETFPIYVTVEGNRVTVSDGDISGSAPLAADGKTFRVPMLVRVSEAGVTCRIEVIFDGTISGATASGPVSGSGRCTGPGRSVPISVSGNFTATAGAAKASLNGGFGSVLRVLVPSVQ